MAVKLRRKEKIVVDRKSIFSLFFVICIFLGVHKTCRALSAEDKLPGEIEFRRYFHNYNFGGIDWDALIDLKNNPILNACINGATLAELESLQITDLTARLQKLQSGNLIRKIDEHYHLNFSVIIGKKQTELKKLVEEVALQLLPTTEKMTEEIVAHLKKNEQMLYHVVWSIVMDGPVAWKTLDNELKKQLGKNDVSIKGTIWWKYPNHNYLAGTNSYYDDTTKMGTAITWTPTTPMPNVVVENLMPYKDEIIQSISQNQPIADQDAVEALAKYGFADEKGALHIYMLDVNTPAFRTFAKSGRTFASETMKHLNLQKVAKILGTSPEEALVIVYHELCYELLKQLADKGILEVPEIALKPKTSSAQMYRLISITTVSDPVTLQRLLEGEF